MKAYWESGDIVPSILDLGTILKWSASRPGHFTPREKPLISIGEEAGWAPEPVWTL
jgi:hypothetical protein